MKHFLKYVNVLQRNNDFLFIIKKRVAKVCVFITILSACETWCCSDYGKLDSIYMGIVKALLAVRKTTCNYLCLVECDMPTLKAAIRPFSQTCYGLLILGLLWTAPEILSTGITNLDQVLEITPEAEVYSFGIIIAELVNGHPPFKECTVMSTSHIVQAIGHIIEPIATLGQLISVNNDGISTTRRDHQNMQGEKFENFFFFWKIYRCMQYTCVFR